jgi:hypothetical protein
MGIRSTNTAIGEDSETQEASPNGDRASSHRRARRRRWVGHDDSTVAAQGAVANEPVTGDRGNTAGQPHPRISARHTDQRYATQFQATLLRPRGRMVTCQGYT